MMANGGKDRFSQIGIGWAVQYTSVDLLNKLYLNVSGMIFQLASYQAFHQGTKLLLLLIVIVIYCDTKLLFIHN